MGLHIGIDAWNLINDRRGIGRYVRMILARWARLDPNRVRTTLIIPEQHTWFAGRRYLEAIDFGPLPVRSRGLADRCGFDAVWFPWNGLSWTTNGVKIATVHDGFFFAWPPKDPMIAAREQRPARAAAREAAQVITDSYFSKSELMKFLDLPPERIDVVHLGVDGSLLGNHKQARFHGASRYVFFVGELESRKGIDTLLEATSLLPQSLRENTVVAIAGRLSERPELHGVPIPTPPTGVRIELLGHVSDERLHSLYAGAAAFIFPSRYEGFGLPVLEAMACGAPVIASDAASIPEAGGDAALYYPVGNAAALADQMARVFTDAELAGKLREAGRRRAVSMSWDSTAEQTLGIFERVVEREKNAQLARN